MDNSKFRILIVDDTPKNLQILANILTGQGYSFEYATNGKAALEWMEETAFDLVLLDIMMPDMDGYEVCAHLKKGPLTKDIPIIFLTAKTETESIVKGFEMGASDYVIKPFNKNELLARISTHLSLRQTQEEIKEKNKTIVDSLNYARRIQQAVLPDPGLLDTLCKEHFIFYRPRDIVSGDFYWIKQIKNFIFIAAADCTGHGVPGAFMSILGVSLLNEILGKSKLDQPNEILNRLRKKIKSSLHQTGADNDQKDGMDMALCMIDTETSELQFAGAFNPLYLIRNGELHEYKGDRQPIAIYENEISFTNHTINIQNNDIIYIFSDGFADQIGGPKDKKFKIQNFKQLLLEINANSMERQFEIIEKTFNDWKGNNEQLDDVLIVGMRFREVF